MSIERLTLEELKGRLEPFMYEYLASEGSLFLNERELVKGSEEYPTPMHMLYRQCQLALIENGDRITEFKKALNDPEFTVQEKRVYELAIQDLEKEREIFTNSNMKFQKKFYAETGCVEYSRTIVKIPLNKVINSYYDDFFLDVAFYDNISVLNGRYNEYNALKTKAERLAFIKKNIEVTHVSLLTYNSNLTVSAIIPLKGKTIDRDALTLSNGEVPLLKPIFADFTKLTLKDTSIITNNDLKQFFQSKIDIDKEEKELLADKNVRGDNYQIYKIENTLFIRYVCRSTGRVYYNELNVPNLSLSDYFRKDEYESYIDSWWSLNNLGASIEGEDMVRC